VYELFLREQCSGGNEIVVIESPIPRVGLIGTGYWGRNILRNLGELGALAAICDLDAALRRLYAEQYPEAVVYSETRDLFDDPDIGAVVISTPASTHSALVHQALDAGKHVFVEKPLCLDVIEAEILSSRARDEKLVLMVGHLLLYHPAFLALQRIVADGRLGKLNYIYSNRLSLGKIRREENALWSFAPHDISMMLALVGSMPMRVSTSGGQFISPSVADTTLAYLEFPDNVHGHIFVSWLHPYKDHRLVVAGESGMVVFDDNAAGTNKLQLFPHRLDLSGELPTFERADGEPIEHAPDEPLRLEMEAFLHAIAGNGQPASDAAEGVRVLRVLDACHRSLLERHAIDLTSEGIL